MFGCSYTLNNIKAIKSLKIPTKRSLVGFPSYSSNFLNCETTVHKNTLEMTENNVAPEDNFMLSLAILIEY